MRLKGTPVQEVEASHLQQLIDNEVPEDYELEYKRDLPSTKGENKEFLRDVSAMANARGGVFIYGMGEKDGAAHEFSPFPKADGDGAVQKLGQVMSNGLKPRISGYLPKLVEVDGGVVLVLGVPQRVSDLHMVTPGDDRFYIRSGTSKERMSVSQIREAFEFAGQAAERLRRFRDDRLGRILVGETPFKLLGGARLVVHMLPLRSQSVGGLDKLWLEYDLIPFDNKATNKAFNADGFIRHGSKSGGEVPFYSQLFRSGGIEFVWALRDCGVENVRGKRYLPPLSVLGHHIGECARRFTSILAKVGVDPPLVMLVSLLEVRGMRYYRQGVAEYDQGPPLNRDTVHLPDVVIDTYGMPEDELEERLRPMFDALWNSGGEPKMP